MNQSTAITLLETAERIRDAGISIPSLFMQALPLDSAGLSGYIVCLAFLGLGIAGASVWLACFTRPFFNSLMQKPRASWSALSLIAGVGV
jgi:hypothetical protein